MLIGVAEAGEQSKSNLVRLISGAEQLAGAANEGKLSTRADASILGGDYRKVVEGLNQAFEKLVEPVRELNRVLRQIAAGTSLQGSPATMAATWTSSGSRRTPPPARDRGARCSDLS